MVVLARGAHSIITEGKIHSGWRDGAVAWRTCCSYRGLRFNLQNQMVATNPCNSSSRWWMPFLHHFVMPCSFPWSCFLRYFISMVWVFCVHVCLCTIHAHPQRPDCEILTPDITFQPLKMKQTLANIGLSQGCLTFNLDSCWEVTLRVSRIGELSPAGSSYTLEATQKAHVSNFAHQLFLVSSCPTY